MPSFQKMFEATKGQPIVYQGNTLLMADHFPTDGFRQMRLTFESCNSEWHQGVSLRILGKGDIAINGKHVKHAVCWRDNAPETVEIEVSKGVGSIVVYNVWDTGNGVTHSWHNGAAMIVEELPNGRRYRCNDGLADDDFDDIVFRLERIPNG